MKKIIFMMLMGLTAGLVMAQDAVMVDGQASDVVIEAEVGLYSAYVWRGQVINEYMVAQPSVTAAMGPIRLNAWGNMNVVDKDQGDTQEIDFTATYTLPDAVFTDAVTVDIGMIAYVFPGKASEERPTEEVFSTATFNHIILTPVLGAYYDINEANGWYGNFALSQGLEIGDAVTAEIGGSIGYGTRNYNRYYFGDDALGNKGENNGSGAVNDYNVYVSAKYALTEQLSLGARLQYTYLDGGVANGADILANDVVWGGVNLSYEF